MKILLLSILALFVFNSAWAEGDDFLWSTKDPGGVQLGGRAKIVEIWGGRVLVIQSAVRNNSANPVCIPVENRPIGLHPKKLDYSVTIVQDGYDPFAEKPHFRLVQYPVLQIDPFLTPVVSPFRFVLVKPKETVLFPPVMPSMGEGPNFSSFVVRFDLKIEAPQGSPPVIRVKQEPNKGIEEEYPEKFDFGMIPVGELTLELSPPTAIKPAEQGGTFKDSKYGDQKLADAEAFISPLHPRPWTVPQAIEWFHKADDRSRIHILRILAASRDPRAALVLGAALESNFRFAASDGLNDYFLPTAVGGGTEAEMKAARDWFASNKARLESAALTK